MYSITEIEAAIEKLPDAEVVELARWLQALRLLRTVFRPKWSQA